MTFSKLGSGKVQEPLLANIPSLKSAVIQINFPGGRSGLKKVSLFIWTEEITHVFGGHEFDLDVLSLSGHQVARRRHHLERRRLLLLGARLAPQVHRDVAVSLR